MARSRKLTPCCHIAGHDSWWKRIFNKRLRRNPIDHREGMSAIQDGMAYKRANESWDISDCKAVGTSFEDSHFDDRDGYEKWYIRK